MELIIIYIWTMLVTSTIGLREKQRGSIFIPRYIKMILILPTRKGENVAIYMIVIHAFMQLATVICLICIGIGMSYRGIQTLYGLFMGGICIIITIICSWIFKKGS